jgi:AbrB family looped-hinge helix DNA binding protein
MRLWFELISIVMHRGRVREIENHQELLKLRGIYWRLYLLQYKDQLVGARMTDVEYGMPATHLKTRFALDGFQRLSYNISTIVRRRNRMRVRLSTKGQLIIPSVVRRALGLQPGTQLDLEVVRHKIVLEPKAQTSPIESLYGRYSESDLLDELEQEHRKEIQDDRPIRA